MKILIEVKTPGNGRIYEYRVDNDLLVGKIKELMIMEITEVEDNNITIDFPRSMLCNMATKTILSDELTLDQAGVLSGHSLLLL